MTRCWLVLSLVALVFFTRAETYNGVVYSTSGDVVPGELTSQFSKAKSYAESKNIPLVVVWANPGCAYCGYLEQEGLASSKTVRWMAERKYIFVFCLGQGDADSRAAHDYPQGVGEYPKCRVHWKRNAAGKTVDKSFSGRWYAMKTATSKDSDGIDDRFIAYVDSILGDTSSSSSSGDGASDAKSVSVADTVLDASSVTAKTAICGVPVSWEVAVGGASKYKVAFSNLPSGLRYDSSSGTITGMPRTARRFSTKVRVTWADGTVRTYPLAITVSALPAWAKGRFYGVCVYGESVGRAQVAVSSAGKVSGKLIAAGSVHSFYATSLQSYENGSFAFTATLPYSYRKGSKLVKAKKLLALTLSADGDLGRLSGGDSAGLSIDLLQNVWSRTDLKVPTFVSGSKAPIVALDSGIKLKIGIKGAVRVGGRYGKTSVSSSSQLVAGCEDGALTSEAEAVISLSGKNFSNGYYGESVDLRIGDTDGDNKLDAVTER